MKVRPRKRGDGGEHTDPDDSWHADVCPPVGSVGFTEYTEPSAGKPKKTKGRRVRMGFHLPDKAYEDD